MTFVIFCDKECGAGKELVSLRKESGDPHEGRGQDSRLVGCTFLHGPGFFEGQGLGFMSHDLGILDITKNSSHKKDHIPNGWVM